MVFHRQSSRTITSEDDKEVPQDSILVIESQARAEDMPGASSRILANERLRDEYNKTIAVFESSKEKLIKELLERSGFKKNIENIIVEDFGKEDNPESIFAILREYTNMTPGPSADLSSIKYAVILDEKVLEELDQIDIKDQLHEYVEKYNELVSKSLYLKTTFDHSRADTVSKKLSVTGFFDAKHSVNLNPKKKKDDRIEITTAQEFDKFIAKEKNSIDVSIKTDWEQIDKKLSGNQALQKFRTCAAESGNRFFDLLLDDRVELRKRLWLSYFTQTDQAIRDLLDSYESQNISIKRLVKKANEERTDWDSVVDMFEKRFFVPFVVKVADRTRSILEDKVPTLEFSFRDGDDVKPMPVRDLSSTMSAGEMRAFYILNVLFKIRDRHKQKKETIIVLDDIVDSFDYANKYAIIQYLKEISEIKFFHLLILTHNFDFFRAVADRHIAERDNCYYAIKTEKGICLEEAHYIKSALLSIVQCEKNDPEKDEKFIAAIPFARNMAEYAHGQCAEYKKLTSLLHWRRDTPKITVGDLEKTLCVVIPRLKSKRNDALRHVYELIVETACRCKKHTKHPLYCKIVLAMAIRLQAEHFMLSRLGPDPDPLSGDPDTHHLIERCKKELHLQESDIETLDDVGIITPSVIHLNAFMYEPIVDIDHSSLQQLFSKVRKLLVRAHTCEAVCSAVV